MTATNLSRREMIDRLKEINLGDVLNVVVTRHDLNLLTTWQAERLLHLFDAVQNARYESQRILNDS